MYLAILKHNEPSGVVVRLNEAHRSLRRKALLAASVWKVAPVRGEATAVSRAHCLWRRTARGKGQLAPPGQPPTALAHAWEGVPNVYSSTLLWKASASSLGPSNHLFGALLDA